MFAFIPFGLKILLASIIGGAINYVPEKHKENHSIIDTSLICIFSASIIGFSKQFIGTGGYSIGFGIFSVVIVIIFISKHLSFARRMTWMFAAVIGMIIGAGFFIQAILLTALIYYITHNSEEVLDYVYKSSEVQNDSANIENK